MKCLGTRHVKSMTGYCPTDGKLFFHHDRVQIHARSLSRLIMLWVTSNSTVYVGLTQEWFI